MENKLLNQAVYENLNYIYNQLGWLHIPVNHIDSATNIWHLQQYINKDNIHKCDLYVQILADLGFEFEVNPILSFSDLLAHASRNSKQYQKLREKTYSMIRVTYTYLIERYLGVVNSYTPTVVKPNFPTQYNIYIPQNDQKQFISFDLSMASFYSIMDICRTVGREDLCFDSYEEMLHDIFSERESPELINFFGNCKEYRTIIFGHLNPKRIKEKNKENILSFLDHMSTYGIDVNLLTGMNHDEVIFETGQIKDINLSEIVSSFKVPIKIDQFTLSKVSYIQQNTNTEIAGYIKEHVNPNHLSLHSCDKNFATLIYKTYLGLPTEDSDRFLKYNSLVCRFLV